MRKAIAYVLFLIAAGAIVGIVLLFRNWQSEARKQPVPAPVLERTDGTEAQEIQPAERPKPEIDPAHEDAVEEAFDDIEKLWNDIDSFVVATRTDGVVRVPTDPDMNEFQEAKTHSEGTIEYQRLDGPDQFRAESTAKLETKGRSILPDMENHVLAVSDGTHLFRQLEVMGRLKVSKRKADENSRSGIMPLSAEQVVSAIKNHPGVLKRLPDDAVGEEPVYVFESKPKNPGNKPVLANQTMKYYVSKKTGLPVKRALYAKDDALLNTTTYTVEALNAPISPDRFNYTPPEGVKVEDMTQPGAQQQGLFQLGPD